jgi:uncharacterized protein (TIGR02271 family)
MLNRSGAIEVENRGETRSEATDSSTSRFRDDARSETGERGTIPVVREELEVEKRTVQRGGVRVHTRVNEQPVEEEVTLREERVRVDRRPADRPATDADFAAAHREVIEVTETVEEPVVRKRARVVEEVVVGKDVHERTETVRDTVKQSDVNVENIRGDRTRNDYETDYDTDFQNHFRTRYGSDRNLRYDDYAPAYRYGYDMASDQRYRGRHFDEIENDLRSDYERRYPGSAWERMKESVRYGWEKVTGKR